MLELILLYRDWESAACLWYGIDHSSEVRGAEGAGLISGCGTCYFLISCSDLSGEANNRGKHFLLLTFAQLFLLICSASSYLL